MDMMKNISQVLMKMLTSKVNYYVQNCQALRL